LSKTVKAVHKANMF